MDMQGKDRDICDRCLEINRCTAVRIQRFYKVQHIPFLICSYNSDELVPRYHDIDWRRWVSEKLAQIRPGIPSLFGDAAINEATYVRHNCVNLVDTTLASSQSAIVLIAATKHHLIVLLFL